MNSDAPDLLPIIVADERNFIRGCLACWLEKFGTDFLPTFSADAIKTLAQPGAVLPAAVILSGAPGVVGSEWIREQASGLRRVAPDLPIVVIMDETATAWGRDLALSIGGQAFIPMSSSLDIAFAALRLVIAGGNYFPYSPQGDASSASTVPVPGFNGKLELTPREQAVCALLSQGLSNKLIARRLNMAVSTVKIHVHHILKKLAVQNRTAVAVRMSEQPGADASNGHLGSQPAGIEAIQEPG